MPFVDNAGIKIRYEVEGRGPPLVLMHGASSRLEAWTEFGLVDALKSDFRLVLIDARGYGQSDKPHDPDAYRPGPRAGDITLILDALGIDSTHFLGYSMGGRIGLDMCMVAPERLKSLVLGGAGTSPVTVLEFAKMFAENDMADIVAGMEAQGVSIPEPARTALLENDIHAVRASLDPSVLVYEKEYSDALLAFDRPVLFYTGSDDPLHDSVRTMVGRMPDAEFLSLPGFDHLRAYRGSATILPQLASFLKRADL